MNHTTTIKQVFARQILDSRGNPTVEAQVLLNNGVTGTAAVPSGASTGQYEAVELRDEADIYCGKSVFKAVENINCFINKELCGMDIYDQTAIDRKMLELDGTENKSNLGANAILAVSLAAARTAAISCKMPLYRYLGGAAAMTMPVPMLNVLNGGAHANNNVEIQEFMIVPIGAPTFTKAMEMSTRVYHSLGHILKESGLGTTVGDEGGFAPNLENDEQALKLLIRAIERTGMEPERDIAIALDAAASEWKTPDGYRQPKTGKTFNTNELIDYFEDLIKRYPIISLEDPLGDDDFKGFAEIRKRTGIQIVGDDLFVQDRGVVVILRNVNTFLIVHGQMQHRHLGRIHRLLLKRLSEALVRLGVMTVIVVNQSLDLIIVGILEQSHTSISFYFKFSLRNVCSAEPLPDFHFMEFSFRALV
jgi:enolase